MLAAARGFRVPHPPRAVLHHQLRVRPQRRQSLPVRHQKLLAVSGNDGGPLNRPGRAAGEPPRKLAQPRFEFAPQDRADPRAPQQPFVQRGVEPVRAEVRARVHRAYPAHQAQKQLGGSVHRQEKRDQARTLHRPAGHRSDRNIRLCDVVAVLPQPRRRRSQPERLAAHLVGGDQQHLHTPLWIAPGRRHTNKKIFRPPFPTIYGHPPPNPRNPSSIFKVGEPSSEPLMSTLRQIEANRRNAQKSTGPTSVTGKAASSMNALKTGIHAKSLVLPSEKPADLEQLIDEYYQQPPSRLPRSPPLRRRVHPLRVAPPPLSRRRNPDVAIPERQQISAVPTSTPSDIPPPNTRTLSPNSSTASTPPAAPTNAPSSPSNNSRPMPPPRPHLRQPPTLWISPRRPLHSKPLHPKLASFRQTPVPPHRSRSPPPRATPLPRRRFRGTPAFQL